MFHVIFLFFVHKGGSRVIGVRGVDWRGLVIQCFNQNGRRRRRRNVGEKRRKGRPEEEGHGHLL